MLGTNQRSGAVQVQMLVDQGSIGFPLFGSNVITEIIACHCSQPDEVNVVTLLKEAFNLDNSTADALVYALTTMEPEQSPPHGDVKMGKRGSLSQLVKYVK